MNYRHIYHAGNFADIFKHIILTNIIVYLQKKPRSIRFIDTHAAIGLYDLQETQPNKTNEWQNGIGRFFTDKLQLTERESTILNPWLELVSSLNEPNKLRYYPGSPYILSQLLRPQDSLFALELHPEDFAELSFNMPPSKRIHLRHANGFKAINALLPPLEAQACILMDPAFETADDFKQMLESVTVGLKKFKQGTYILWYPIKDKKLVDNFLNNLKLLKLPTTLKSELHLANPELNTKLAACGLIIINPPFNLINDIKTIEDILRKVLKSHGNLPAPTINTNLLQQ